MEETIDDFQLQIDTDPCQYLQIVKVSISTFQLFQTEVPQIPNSSISSNLGMASLLNDLADKLDAADNNSNEPDDPNNAVVEDKDTDDSLVDILTVDEVSIVETRAR